MPTFAKYTDQRTLFTPPWYCHIWMGQVYVLNDNLARSQFPSRSSWAIHCGIIARGNRWHTSSQAAITWCVNLWCFWLSVLSKTYSTSMPSSIGPETFRHRKPRDQLWASSPSNTAVSHSDNARVPRAPCGHHSRTPLYRVYVTHHAPHKTSSPQIFHWALRLCESVLWVGLSWLGCFQLCCNGLHCRCFHCGGPCCLHSGFNRSIHLRVHLCEGLQLWPQERDSVLCAQEHDPTEPHPLPRVRRGNVAEVYVALQCGRSIALASRVEVGRYGWVMRCEGL